MRKPHYDFGGRCRNLSRSGSLEHTKGKGRIHMDRDFKNYSRGEIYFANLDPHFGSEQGGVRPVLVIQNDKGNNYSPTLIVAAVTKRTDKKPYLPTHVVLNHIPGMQYDGDSLFMMEQLNTIDKHRLRGYVGHLTAAQMSQIDQALQYSLGLTAIPNKTKPKGKTDESALLCLCPSCRSKFFDARSYYITRANPRQREKDTCTFCQSGRGYDYYVTPYQWNRRANDSTKN